MYGNHDTTRKWMWAGIAGLCAILAACASTSGSLLPGMVYTRDGQPLEGVCISLDGIPAGTSDVCGRFKVPRGSESAPVLIRLEKAGYRPVSRMTMSLREETPDGLVLWFRMSSARDVLGDAWTSMEAGDWNKAELLLAEAESLNPANPLNAPTRLLLGRLRKEGIHG